METEATNTISVSDIISIFAVAISIISLIWNIVNATLEKLPRAKVQLSSIAKMIAIPGIGVGKPRYFLMITVTNKSNFNLYINIPHIKFKEKIDNHDSYSITSKNNPVDYPVCIKPREQYKIEIDLNENILNLFLKCKNKNGNIRIKINDTTNKNFYSNKMSIKYIINLAKINCK